MMPANGLSTMLVSCNDIQMTASLSKNIFGSFLDLILLVYDYTKLDIGPQTELLLDQLKGRETQVCN